MRDALSILDQAIVQHKSADGSSSGDGGEIGPDAVRDMLGLADRTQIWDLVGACLKGDAKAALDGFSTQYDAGAEPAVILRDMLDIVHLLTRVKAAGPAAAAHGAAGEADAERALKLADGLELNALTRAWSLLMKGLAETGAAPDPAAAGEMALIRLCFAADLPTPDEALKALKKNSENGRGTVSASPETRPQPAPHAPSPSATIINIEPPLRSNVGVSVGDDGILLIDAMNGRQDEALLKTIRGLSDAPVRYVINTHSDRDHTGGNAVFAEQGATIFGQENARYSKALVHAYFKTKMLLNANGERVEAHHVPSHSHNDALSPPAGIRPSTPRAWPVSSRSSNVPWRSRMTPP